MGNSIKYTTGTESNSLSKGNFRIGTGDVGKGPSSTTGFYKATAPPSGGYRIYLNNESVSGNIAYHTAANDSELISFTNQIADESFTTVIECFNYYNTQTNKICVNSEIAGIPTDGLYIHQDYAQVSSYIRTGNTVNSLTSSDINALIANGATYSTTNGGGLLFDGLDDYVEFENSAVLPNLTNGATLMFWLSNWGERFTGGSLYFFRFGTTFFNGGFRRGSVNFASGEMSLFIANAGNGRNIFSPFANYHPDFTQPTFVCLSIVPNGSGGFVYGATWNNNIATPEIELVNFGVQINYGGILNVGGGGSIIGASPQQSSYSDGVLHYASFYSKTFYPESVTTNQGITDYGIPKEIQQYYDATKGRFGL